MTYTVKKLAKISGVSVRTLHWYDKIGLLKPFAKGANNYRYYKEEQLLRLQQILFFKEVGFTLNDIQNLLSQNDFVHIKALKAHRKILQGEIVRKNDLITTIDKTIEHLRGKQFMKYEELYYGFDTNRQQEYEKYIVQYHDLANQNLLIQSKQRTSKWDKDDWNDLKNESNQIYKDLAEAIDNGLKSDSIKVQAIIERHFNMIQRFYDVTKEVYIGLTKLYAQHPDFKKFFDVYHPKMIQFIDKSMRYYANKNL